MRMLEMLEIELKLCSKEQVELQIFLSFLRCVDFMCDVPAETTQVAITFYDDDDDEDDNDSGGGWGGNTTKSFLMNNFVLRIHSTQTPSTLRKAKKNRNWVYILLNRPKSNFNATKFVWKCQDLRSIRGICSVVHTPTHSYFMMVLLNQKLHFNLFRIFDKIFTLKFFWSFCWCVHSLKNIAFLHSHIQCSMPLGWKPL